MTTSTTGAISTQRRADEPTGCVVLESVTKRFGDAIAVNDIDLRVEPGEFLSLLGPSGCGKTTTLRMLAGFETPDSGSIRISGVDVLGTPPYKRNVNTVFQAYALFPHLSVAENVAYGLQQKKVPKPEIKERVKSALDMVKMLNFADRKPTQLSGGQQQRIALARALINQPAVLLLDEPLGALDRQLREEMQLELKLLQSQLGITFIFVTHDQGEALSMSDRIAIMRDGKIEQLADAETIYSNPASAYVAGFIGQQNFFDGNLSKDGLLENAKTRIKPGIPLKAPAGSSVRAAVRPEDVEIRSTEPSSRINAISGDLVSVSHLGETLQFLVDTGDGRTVLARRPRPGAPKFALKSKVWCTWEQASVLMFHAHEEPAGSSESPKE